MDIVIMVGQLLLGLSILVILHEFGHFIAARAFGIKVEKFYLFFDAWNFSLFKFTYKGVEYGIGWLPLGGYVKIAGMIDESMDTEQMAGPPQPWEFRSKPAWQRLIVMLGGIIVNVILGVFIFWMLTLRYGESYVPNDSIKYGIVPGKIGTKVGLKAGDHITAINGKPVEHFEDLLSSKVLLGNTILTVMRNGGETKVTVPADILNDVHDYGIEEFVAPRRKFAIDTVKKGSFAEKAGILHGDSILAINKAPIGFLDQLHDELAKYKNHDVNLFIKRGADTMTLKTSVNKNGMLGFTDGKTGVVLTDDTLKSITTRYGFAGALPVGAGKAWDLFSVNAQGLGKVIKGEVKANKAISGPVAMARMFGSKINWLKFWTMVGLLSMALALMNLLPIPALDGGHAMFLIIEMIKGKPLSDKFMERAQLVGFVILVCLMVFVFGNDITNAIKHK